MYYKDLRQSNKWTEYLKLYRWHSEQLSKGYTIRFANVWFFSIAKLQRPFLSLSSSDFMEIDAACKKNKSAVLVYEPIPEQDLEQVKQAGFVEGKHPNIPTVSLALRITPSEEELWKGLSESAKYSVRRAKREKCYVVIDKNPNKEVQDSFFSVLKYRGEKKGYTVQGLSDLRKKISAFGDNSYIIRAFDSAGNISAVKLFLGFENCVWYEHGGTSAAGQKNKCGYLLNWEAISYFKKEGFEFIDWDGLVDTRFPAFAKAWENFTNFKKKFGGFEVTYPYPYIKYYSRALEILGRFGFTL